MMCCKTGCTKDATKEICTPDEPYIHLYACDEHMDDMMCDIPGNESTAWPYSETGGITA